MWYAPGRVRLRIILIVALISLGISAMLGLPVLWKVMTTSINSVPDTRTKMASVAPLVLQAGAKFKIVSMPTPTNGRGESSADFLHGEGYEWCSFSVTNVESSTLATSLDQLVAANEIESTDNAPRDGAPPTWWWDEINAASDLRAFRTADGEWWIALSPSRNRIYIRYARF